MNTQDLATSVNYLGIQWGMPGHHFPSIGPTTASHDAYGEAGSAMSAGLFWRQHLRPLGAMHWPTVTSDPIKASGRGPVAGPGFGARSPAAWSIGHARPYVSEAVRKDLQNILVHIKRRFTMYHPWVLKLDLIIGSNALIFKNNSPRLILSDFGILERPASKGKSHDSGHVPVHWEEVEMVFYLGGREKYDFHPSDPHKKRPWCWERLKAGGEGGDRGWDHQLNGHESEQAPGVGDG